MSRVPPWDGARRGGAALARVIRGTVRRRRLQTGVIGVVVMLSTATALLALGLIVVSDGPFDRAFDQQVGAHATATFDSSVASADAVAATAHQPGVVAAAGPFDSVDVGLSKAGLELGSTHLVGRADAGGVVDRLSLDAGTWLTGPGQVVLARDFAGPRVQVGVTVTTGSATLRVVGIADSITGTADGWVWPTQADVLHPVGAPASRQMLYRFGAADDSAVRAGIAAATAKLPPGALLGTTSYLTVKFAADRSTAPVVPFVVAFAVLGIVMSVLIVANVVSGAVVAGYRTIGVLKALGFSPGQVVAVFTGQALLPAAVGCAGGIVLGNVLALPLLAQTNRAYDVAATATVPIWVDAVIIVGLPLITGVAAAVPAWRAGRYSATTAISVGRAPRTGRGYRVRRALAATRLPRAVSFGLGTPFARPGRSAVTVAAILLGAVTVVFAAGLSTSLQRVSAGFSRIDQVPVEVDLAVGGRKDGQPTPSTSTPAAVGATIAAQPGTAHVVGVRGAMLHVAGLSDPVSLETYDDDATWAGYQLVSGRWYAGADEVVAASYLLHSTGTAVGDTITLSTESGRRQVRVTGEILSQDFNGLSLIANTTVLNGLAESAPLSRFEVGLTADTNPQGYVDALSAVVDRRTGRPSYRGDRASNRTFTILLGLVSTLALLLAAVAALGVFNTVVLNSREQVHDIGVLKAIGMTPRQVRVMVITSMALVGAVAGTVAVPLGSLLHHSIVPIMANAAGVGLPVAAVAVYTPSELLALGATGLLLAVAGALVPAGWAARSRAASALRAE
jgi:putative ABC transport system permease protein